MAEKTIVDKAGQTVGIGMAMASDLAGAVKTAVVAVTEVMKKAPPKKAASQAGPKKAAKKAPAKKAGRTAPSRKSPPKAAKKSAKKPAKNAKAPAKKRR